MFKYFFIIAILILSLPTFAGNFSYRIVGGEEAEKNKWPWMIVQIDHNAPSSNNAQFCGGSLIHAQWVLTAAHCFLDNSGNIDTRNKPDIVIGRHDLSTSEGQRIAVSQIIIHPSYNPFSSNDSDIALLELSSPVSNVAPVLLPGQNYNAAIFTSGTATALGWGNRAAQSFNGEGGSDFPTNLHQVSGLPILSNEACMETLGSDITDQMVCAGLIEGGKDTCQGDSGGPLIVDTNMGSGDMQIGITSFGSGCAQPESYGVYTRVSRFSSWVSDSICSSSEVPDAPVLSLAVNGNTVTASYNATNLTTHYRLYYAPASTLSPIRYVEMGALSSLSVNLSSGTNYKVAIRANNNNCASVLSNIEEFTIQ
ncbi:MAG: serine protease [Pseudomonadota bacterium]